VHCWLGQLGRHDSALVWKMIPHCVIWCLWRERNARLFDDSECHILELKLFFFHTLLDWVVGSGVVSIHSILELIDLCKFDSFVPFKKELGDMHAVKTSENVMICVTA
jgi:hypothetical protein